MSTFPLRILASVITLAVVGQPHAAQARPVGVAQDVMDAARGARVTIIGAGGKGSPVFLIPGLSSPAAVWDGVVPDLIKSHQVFIVQVNGFDGDSPDDNLKPGILDGVVAEIDQFITSNKLRHAAVIGHSMGGLVGLMLAKAHPADVGKLMIVDSLPWFGMLFGPTATVAAVEPRAKAMRDAMAASFGKPDAASAARTAAALALKPASQATVVKWVMKADARVSAQAMYEDMTTDMRGDLKTIATPITMLYPVSAGLPAAKATPFYTAAYAAPPHVTMVPINDSAHFIMLDQPEAFAKAVTAFAG